MIPKYRMAKTNMPATGAIPSTPLTMKPPVFRPKPPASAASGGDRDQRDQRRRPLAHDERQQDGDGERSRAGPASERGFWLAPPAARMTPDCARLDSIAIQAEQFAQHHGVCSPNSGAGAPMRPGVSDSLTAGTGDTVRAGHGTVHGREHVRESRSGDGPPPPQRSAPASRECRRRVSRSIHSACRARGKPRSESLPARAGFRRAARCWRSRASAFQILASDRAAECRPQASRCRPRSRSCGPALRRRDTAPPWGRRSPSAAALCPSPDNDM